MTLAPRMRRGTGFCDICGSRMLLAANGKLFLHSRNPDEEKPEHRVRCPGSMTHRYTPGPDRKETT